MKLFKNEKRITVFAGHYGSGKTNLAVNYAIALRRKHEKVAIADLDIVNPYFRTSDASSALDEHGVRLIAGVYAGSNVDIPAIPAEANSIIDDISTFSVVDVGGDDRGALALGRYAKRIKQENDYEMTFVVNFYRPLTRTAKDAFEVMREIEEACEMQFTSIINNSNLGDNTKLEDVLSTIEKAEELSALSNRELIGTCIREDICKKQNENNEKLFAVKIYVSQFL